MRFFPSFLSLSLLSILLAPAKASSQAQEPLSEATSSESTKRVLSLQDSISLAMGKSHLVIAAENSRDAAKEQKRNGFARLGPSATVSYNELHYEDKQTANFGGNNLLVRDDVIKTGSLVVTQPITGLYGYIENARLSDLQQDLAEENLRSARMGAGFMGAEAFLRAYNAEEQLKIAEGSLAAAQSSANDASVAQRVGRLNQADYLKLQVNLSQAQTRLLQARAERASAIANLKQILRLSESENISLQADLPEANISEPAVDQAIKDGLDKRSDVRIAAMNAETVSFQKKLAYTEFIPTVDVFGQLDRNFGESTAFGNQDKDVKYWGIRANWTFWNNGASVFKTRQAFAQTRAAEANAEMTKDQARVKIISAVENLKAAREGVKFAELGMKQAEEAYRIDGIRFKNGSISATDQVLSQNSKAFAQGEYVNARTRLLLAYFSLQQALGQEQPTL